METILKLTDLTKKYGNKVVVDNLNIEIQKGEIFGLLGPLQHRPPDAGYGGIHGKRFPEEQSRT